MIEFFKTFSGANASFLGVMLAFLISKIMSLEEKSEFISEEFESKLHELEEIKIIISTMGLENIFYDNAYEKIVEKLNKKNFFEIDKNNILEDIKLIISKKEYFFLDLEKTYENIYNLILKKNIDELNEKIKEMELEELTKLENSKIIKIIENNKKEAFFTIKKAISDKKNEIILDKNLSPVEKMVKIAENYNISNINKNMSRLIELESKKILNNKLPRNLQKNLEIYLFKRNILKNIVKKSRNLKSKSIIFQKIIIGSIFIFIFGIIYPLSFVKYKTDDLDFTLYNNFFKELFSISGLFLFLISIVFFIFSIYLYKILQTGIENEKELLDKLKEFEKAETKEYYIKTYIFYKDIINKKS